MEAEELRSEIRQLLALARQGNVEEARRRYKRLFEVQPPIAPAWLAASHVEMTAGNAIEALQLASRCLELDPSRPPRVLLQMAIALRALLHAEEALVPAREALASPAADPELLDGLGRFFTQCGRREEAFAAHARASAARPDDEEFGLRLVTAARDAGRLDVAEQECDRWASAGTPNREFYLVRSQLRTQTTERNHIAQLRGLLEGSIHGAARVQLQYALGKELQDCGDYAAAYVAYETGARLHREARNYEVKDDITQLDRIRAVYDAEWLKGAGRSTQTARPIFLVGLPGTSIGLVERVLQHHPGITFVGALPSFGHIVNLAAQTISGRRVTERERVGLARSAPPDSLGSGYLKHAALVTRPTGRFVDSSASNYLHCALIKAALPAATVVHVSRHPMADCFALFSRWSGEADPFANDLKELAQYYAAYRRLMQHWSALMPGAIVAVSYERLLADFEGEVKRLVTSCGLAWDERCLAAVRTPPEGPAPGFVPEPADLWRRYGERLEPLRQALVAAGVPATECA